MNGYTRITINGNEYGVKFTMWAIEKIDELNALHVKPMEKVANMIYAALLNNCRHNKTTLDLTYEDVELFVDDLLETEEGRAVIKQVNDCLEDSGSYKHLLKQAEDSDKKKLNGMPSIVTPLAS